MQKQTKLIDTMHVRLSHESGEEINEKAFEAEFDIFQRFDTNQY